MSVDAVVSTLAGSLCKEITRTVVVVLAGVTFVALAFEVELAQLGHVCDSFSARRS